MTLARSDVEGTTKDGRRAKGRSKTAATKQAGDQGGGKLGRC